MAFEAKVGKVWMASRKRASLLNPALMLKQLMTYLSRRLIVLGVTTADVLSNCDLCRCVTCTVLLRVIYV